MRPFFPLTWTAGERKLPGGRAMLLTFAFTLAACGGASTSMPSPAATTAAPSPTLAAAPQPSGFPPIPTLGGQAATGVILPTYFVTILESRFGMLSVVTTPGSACTLKAVMPDGAVRSDPELAPARTADAGGRASFTYPATGGPAGLGMHTVSCTLAAQREQAQARFEVK